MGTAVAVSGRGGHSFWERWQPFLGEVRFFCRGLSRGKCLSGACGADCLGEVPINLLHLSQNTLPPLPKPSHTSLKCCCQRDSEGRNQNGAPPAAGIGVNSGRCGRAGAELMRSKCCVRHELNLCPKQGKAPKAEPLYLINGGSDSDWIFTVQHRDDSEPATYWNRVPISRIALVLVSRII